MKKILTLILFVTLILTTACGNDSEPGKLRVMLGSNVVSLDTAKATDNASFEVIADCIDGLLQMDKDGRIIPAIAESYDVSPDGKTYTFHLRNAKWSNGDEVTADDFVFAWRRHCQVSDKYAYIMGSTVACIKNADAVVKGADPKTLGVSAPDSKTFVVELDAPVPFFPSLMVFPTFYPINEKFYNSLESGTYGTTHENFLYNGAFVMTSYVPGSASIQLQKNPDYWDAANVTLEKLHYQVVSSSDNALTAYRNKSLDLVTINGNQIEYVKSDGQLSKDLHIITTGLLQYLTFNQDPKNHHAGALSNVNLRLAISNSIDRESLVNNYVMNGSRATYTAIPIDFAPNAKTGKFFAEDQKQFAEYVGFNPDKAKEYFERAKSELGRNDFDLTLIYANDAGDTVIKVVQAVKAQVEENLQGVKITLQPMTKAEYLDKVTTNSYDMAVTNWTPDYDDPMTFFTLWTTEGSEISEHWSNAEYDRIIAECTTGNLAADYNARWNALYSAEKILLENAVIAPLYTGANTNLVAENVSGVDFHSVAVDRVYKHAVVK
ncbi:MAG: peptide ABC transporter substrate-binding protein [Selenomonadaceae bacterium]|nr:peptide ABC transporter substrate-binding protein [Selenomonadaceae bacterium]